MVEIWAVAHLQKFKFRLLAETECTLKRLYTTSPRCQSTRSVTDGIVNYYVLDDHHHHHNNKINNNQQQKNKKKIKKKKKEEEVIKQRLLH